MASSFGTSQPHRQFEMSDQIEFAELSGDYNPIHLDAIAARRTSFGQPIVHGLHIALWMLDWFAGTGESPLPFSKISVRFNRALFLGEDADIELRRSTAGVELTCLSNGALLTQLKLSDPAPLTFGPWSPSGVSWSNVPAVLDIDSIQGHSSKLTLPYQERDIARLFPAAIRLYGAAPISHILALTRIVGMEAPGLHSLFGAFSVEIHSGIDNTLNFSTARVNAKTSHVQIAFSSDVLTGTADTFVRPRPEVTNHQRVTKDVQPGEFSGRRSLIVGGSRGLGLVTAYLLSAGGADVVITYKVGRAEAEQGIAEIREAGGKAVAIALDVASSAAGFACLANQSFKPTDVYYFATPHIFERKKALFEPEIFDRFVKCYVTDFYKIIDFCAALSPERLSIFFPSSDALNNPVKELLEYSAAKAAGESFCEMMSQFNPRVTVLTARLPRLPTDQTATLMKIGTADPGQVMLEICRKLGSSETRGSS
jgi:NAD(P)-dependent dehydrogenase (short-subunit alcohol dehydrogenase family)